MAYRLSRTSQITQTWPVGRCYGQRRDTPNFRCGSRRSCSFGVAEHLPERPHTLRDPCCGSGYLLTVLGLRQRARLAAVVVSDIAPDAVALARENLALLTLGGLQARAEVLQARHGEFARQVHADAAAAAGRRGGGFRPAAATCERRRSWPTPSTWTPSGPGSAASTVSSRTSS